MRPDRLFPLFADVDSLKGVGPRVREAAARAFGVRVKDLLLTPPASIVDRSNRPPLSGARTDEIGTFKVTVASHMPPSNRSRPYRIRAFAPIICAVFCLKAGNELFRAKRKSLTPSCK